MSLTLRLIIGSLLVLNGIALIAVALLGASSRLRHNRFAGVRTSATLRSEAAFVLANRVAAPPIGAAGLVAAVGGAVVLFGRPGASSWVVLAVAVVGTLVLAGLGGTLGDRAASGLVPPPTCGGACAGCDVVAGCRDDPASG